MTSTSHAEPNSALPLETRTCLDQLADLLLERYHITAPPVPVRVMLKQPLDQLSDMQSDQILSYDAIVCFAELGLPIPADTVIDLDA
jgi:hypothetical protein